MTDRNASGGTRYFFLQIAQTSLTIDTEGSCAFLLSQVSNLKQKKIERVDVVDRRENDAMLAVSFC